MIHSVLEQTEPALLVHLPKQAPIQIFRAVQGATVDPTSEGLRCFFTRATHTSAEGGYVQADISKQQ